MLMPPTQDSAYTRQAPFNALATTARKFLETKLSAVQARRLHFPPVLVYHHSPLSPSSVLDAALCIVLANAPQCPR